MADDRLIQVYETSGDVDGPSSAIDENIAVFDGTTGKLIKDSGNTIAEVLARANHTGTQAVSTISDFASNLAGTTNTSVFTPTANYHVATKKYVDDNVTSPMVYPDTGIALSTGSAWETSITNNSTNWNTAYTHSQVTTGNPHSLNLTDIGETYADINYWTQTGSDIWYNTGKVGIGSSSTPAEKMLLYDSGTGSVFLQIANSTTTLADNKGLYVGLTSTELGYVGTRHDADLYFAANNVVGIILKSGGNVGIGDLSPNSKLEIQQSEDISTGGIAVTNSLASHRLFLWIDSNGIRRIDGGNSGTYDIALNNGGGKIGIGTTSPQGHLDINTETAETTKVWINGESSQDKYLYIRHKNNSEAALNVSAAFVACNVDNYGTLGHLNSSGTKVDVLNWGENGNVGIGTTSPIDKLHVVMGEGTLPSLPARAIAVFQNNDNTSDNITLSLVSGNTGDSYIEFGDEQDADIGYIRYDHSVNSMLFRTNATLALTIDNAQDATFVGEITAVDFIQSSDIRLKENIIKIQPSNIDNVDIIQFNFKDDKKQRLRYGVIAQELEKIHPEMVHTNKEGFKQVSYTDYTMVKLAKKDEQIKELTIQIKDLTERIKILEK